MEDFYQKSRLDIFTEDRGSTVPAPRL